MTEQPRELTESLARSIFVCLGAYVMAGCVALGVGYTLAGRSPILIAAVADVAATCVIFGFSCVYRNSSLYDPYWSVAPVPIAVYWALNPVVSDVNALRQILVLVLVTVWSTRLTANWLRRWQGLGHEDWRYTDFRDKTGRAYWVVDLMGIHMFPTIQVFLGCLASYPALSVGTKAPGLLDGIAVTVTAVAIWIEAAADKQLHRFAAGEKNPGDILAEGLWAYSRHPNYFGEIMFWWGLYLFGLAAAPSYWWTIIGPISITMMFAFISIPMIDRRSLERRPGYEEHMRRVSACIPWFPKESV